MVFYCLGGIAFLPWGDLCDLRTTWFVISPYLAAVNQAQSTKIQLFGPGSLGLCAKEKSTLTNGFNVSIFETLTLKFLTVYNKPKGKPASQNNKYTTKYLT